MTEEERTGVRHMINLTIERLEKASVGANHMGSRYARLLRLLWRKPPKRNGGREPQQQATINSRMNAQLPQDLSSNNFQNQQFDPNYSGPMGMANMA
jgi:hypothetical protein